MIRAIQGLDGIVLEAHLPPGSTAYIDAEWLGDALENGVPAVVVDAAGTLSWCDGPEASLPAGIDPDAAAGAAFLSIALEAVAAVEGVGGVIHVSGNGVIASYVRLLLADRAARLQPEDDSTPVAAIIDTTGDPEVIAEATRTVADLGSIVLAGESRGRSLALDLYPDVHVRGLRLVGIRAPREALSEEVLRDPRIALFSEAVESVLPDTPLKPQATCYRVSTNRLAPPGSQSSPARA